MRQGEPPITAHNEVPATLQRIVIEPYGLALDAPFDILPQDPWAVDAPDRVATQAICTVHRSRRISQKARPREDVLKRSEPAGRVGWLEELSIEEPNPVSHSLLIREREDKQIGVTLMERAQEWRLTQLCQVFITVESAEMAQEHQRNGLCQTGKLYLLTLEIGDDKIWGWFTHPRQVRRHLRICSLSTVDR